MSQHALAIAGFSASLLCLATEHHSMTWQSLLSSVRNDRVEFATMRPPSSQFVTLERRVFVTAPPDLVKLAAIGDPAVLDALVPLLADRDRAWAAQVLLSAMTRHEDKFVDTWATEPNAWWEVMGKDAVDRWQAWLDANRGKLVWDGAEQCFKRTD
jgi:hypothetical protein